jgi:DNA-directed RNA polymerase subunit beta
MNLGQIYETVLGWAGQKMGVKDATPIFDGATLSEIDREIAKAGVSELGSTYRYDGETGNRFDQPTTVGVVYMLKLSHMVDDKMGARSIGPYSPHPLSSRSVVGTVRWSEVW